MPKYREDRKGIGGYQTRIMRITIVDNSAPLAESDQVCVTAVLGGTPWLQLMSADMARNLLQEVTRWI